ncbi:unnamed protein product [Rotaria sp. Silwood1]|nr:unnamed protein product [Rotaria sp. Silwood1]
MLDADNNLFIVDSGNQRIVRVGANGFRCLIGCSKSWCSKLDEVCQPLTAAFDSYGNIFITNQYINGIQKFVLSSNFCIQSTIQTTTVKSTTRSTTTSIIEETCFRPTMTLFPTPSSLEIPLQFRRSQDFYISATLTLNCAESLEIEAKWSIFNCTPNCTVQATIDPSINLTLNELFIPARTLSYGVYELKLTVTMQALSNLFSSQSAFVKINPSGITANLVKFGTSLITSSYEENLILDPGKHSINPDETMFNASDWTYRYRCRLYNSTHMGRDSYIYENTSSCFSNRADNMLAWRYNSTDDSQSSVTIPAKSLKYDRTYQFSVFMINRRNMTSQATGYLLVRVDNTRTSIIAVACVISTMCSPNLDYQYINPSTQVALFSVCTGHYRAISNIQWNIYQGSNDSLTTVVEWTRFNHTDSSQNLHFLGLNTTNFTAIKTLFINNPNIEFWRFEVVYTFYTETSSSALDFIINQPPENGTCSIDPENGTTNTLFTINCTDWFDEDGIQDYSFYLWSEKSSELVMLAFTTISTLDIKLPAGDNNSSSLNITVHIRDTLNCVKEFHIEEPIVVILDEISINTFINIIQNIDNKKTNDPIRQALASGNQNIVIQTVTIVSQELNKRNKHELEIAIKDGIPAEKISISPLGSQKRSETYKQTNSSMINEYINKLNMLAKTRDYLMKVTTNLAITTIDSIKLQASNLVQLTESINELTRTTSILASQKCYQLACRLKAISMRVSYEDAKYAATQISYCINNVLTAINAPLQQRGFFLNTNSIQQNNIFNDYDDDPELILLNLNNDFSKETVQTTRIHYYQQKTANEISKLANETILLITSILKIHLNIGQKITMKSSSLLVDIETTTIESLLNKSFEQIYIPSNIQTNLLKNTTIIFRSTIHSLAPADANFQISTNTNMSTAISLSLFDQFENEIFIYTNNKQPIEFFIFRDSNFILPKMFLQNVTLINSTESFYLNIIHINETIINKNLTISLHFEIRPFDINIGYIFIYKFDGIPYMNSSKIDIDKWLLFCPSNLTKEGIYKYFIDNRQISNHKLIIFGLREFNSTEIENFCIKKSINSLLIFDEPFNFTSNYELRTYTSGCYYLDKNNNWQSDGLWVGPLTDHYKTQCFSTHLTTFASSFQVLFNSIYKNEFIYLSKDENNLKKNFTQFKQLECPIRYKSFIHAEYIFKQIGSICNNTTYGKEFDSFELSFYEL